MDGELTRRENVIRVCYYVIITMMTLLAVGYLFGDDRPFTDTYGFLWLAGALLVRSVYDYYHHVKKDHKNWVIFDVSFIILIVAVMIWTVW
ncbi:hypothetical protein [Alkalibacillus salilacus]|uniref:Cytochrome C oxidase subunit IV n=1 Tax=Alkalibacillus salilacus TaxID=284582 RepID=A0ABT9VGQ2_9BACI|nr:hypothetical protein [Alkalibacillus salilacus]MDQ0159990.1 hypothetical protein [Alkalibacillus salilacus]